MYNYNKGRNRSSNAISSKDHFLLGPQFSLQATATGVSEKPIKQKEVGGQVKVGDLAMPGYGRHSASSLIGTTDSSVLQTTSGIPRRGSGSSTRTKRHMLPATAYAHDLTSPDPLGPTDMELDTWSQRSSVGSAARVQQQPNASYLPGDRVVFAESPSAPGVPIVYRTPEEKAANPDRLNLDRRRLTVCPLLEGEEQLRLLNYQHNLISRIQHLAGLRRLIFLDLYDNQLMEISGLSALRSLRVLMLGKNRIQKIEGLDHLTKLDVLDLHGNQIHSIQGLCHLCELRVLNLAGNQIDDVDNLGGMDSLTELNLRRNQITSVCDVDSLPSIQRLFLSFNSINSFEDIKCLSDSHSLSEVSLDGNPLAQDPHYKQTMLRHMQQLRQLDMKRISEDERRIATVMARKEEEKKRESNKVAIMKEKRRLAINNARRQWELMQGAVMARTGRLLHTSHQHSTMPDLVASHVATIKTDNHNVDDSQSSSSSRASRPVSAKSAMSDSDVGTGFTSLSQPMSAIRARPASPLSRGTTPTPTPTPEAEKSVRGTSSGGSLNANFLSELEGDTLSLYGPGALDALDKNWGIQAAGAVNTIIFRFIDFEEIAKHLHKIRVRFPNVHSMELHSTNLNSLNQLNALTSLRRLDHLVVDTEANPVTCHSLWRIYLLFRLAHFCLKTINHVEVTASDIVNAEKFFGTLAHITTSQLPQSRLLALLGEKKKQFLGQPDTSRKTGIETRLVDRTTESVGRAGLAYNLSDGLSHRSQDQSSRRHFVKNYVREMTQQAVQTDHKRARLQQLWPQIFYEMVQTAVVDMWDSQQYMKVCLDELERS